MAWVGQFRAATTTLSSAAAGGIDDESDGIVVEVEHARRLIHAVSRAHTYVAVDFDFEAHGRIVGSHSGERCT